MTPDDVPGGPPAPPRISGRFCETVAATLLLLWRAWILGPRELAQDVLALVALYWLILGFAAKTRLRGPLTFAAMAGLFILYASGQVPRTLSLLGHGP